MKSFAKYIESEIEKEPENKLLEASSMYEKKFGTVPEMSYYKTLERMSKQGQLIHLTKGVYYRPKRSRFGVVPINENDIINHYAGNGKGLVIGYRLFNRKGITTQISKRVEVLSSSVSEREKNIGNVTVKNCNIKINSETIPVIETLEILQNYSNIEDANNSSLIRHMKEFSENYSDSATAYVIKNRKYKKSTIAFMERFLNHYGVENSLNQFLSPLSTYAIPEIEGIRIGISKRKSYNNKKGKGRRYMSDKRLNNSIFLMYLVSKDYMEAHGLSPEKFRELDEKYLILNYVAECPDIFDNMTSKEMIEEIDRYVGA